MGQDLPGRCTGWLASPPSPALHRLALASGLSLLSGGSLTWGGAQNVPGTWPELCLLSELVGCPVLWLENDRQRTRGWASGRAACPHVLSRLCEPQFPLESEGVTGAAPEGGSYWSLET